MAFTETNEFFCLLCPADAGGSTAYPRVTPLLEHLRKAHGFAEGDIRGRYQPRAFMDGARGWARQVHVWVIDGRDVIQHTWTREPVAAPQKGARRGAR